MLKSEDIQITGSFDGGNPKNPNSIIQTGPNAFTIIPFSEDGDPNYKFRLDIKVLNKTSDAFKLDLTIDWQEPRFNHLRDYIYSKHDEEIDWTYSAMTVKDSVTWGDIEVKPGITCLCMHPKYNYMDYLDFIHSISENDRIQKIKIGETREKREIFMIKISVPNRKPQKKILIVSRIHPYETAGSYCMEGIIDHFIDHFSPLIFDLLPFTFYLIPMANPDGVYNGLCKRTGINGVDLSKEEDSNEQTCSVFLQLMDSIRPDIYCEIHNWMLPDVDGIYFLNRFKAFRFIRHFPKKARWNKRWRVHLKKKLFATAGEGFKRYCRQKFGSTAFVLEFPWSGRSVRDMQAIGAATLKALAHM